MRDKILEPIASAVAPYQKPSSPEESVLPEDIKEPLSIVDADVKIEQNETEIASKSNDLNKSEVEVDKIEQDSLKTEPLLMEIEPVVTNTEPISIKQTSNDLSKVPYSSNNPEIVSLEAVTCKINDKTSVVNESIIPEVKKGKLDILKEGGLEVTPVKTMASSEIRDNRPSVIHQALTNIQITDKQSMPPPAVISATLIKRVNHVYNNKTIPFAKEISSSKLHVNGLKNSVLLLNSSIFTPNNKIVYGDPYRERILHPPPERLNSIAKQTGDILDLSMKKQDLSVGNHDLSMKSEDLSLKHQQKPTLEIVRVPSLQSNTLDTTIRDLTNNNIYDKSPLQLLDGRKVGSNLEITLVDPNKNQNNLLFKPNAYFDNNRNNCDIKNAYKRPLNEKSLPNKQPRLEENGRSRPMKSYYPVRENGSKPEVIVSSPYNNQNRNPMPPPNNTVLSKNVPPTLQSPISKNYPLGPSYLPNYLSQVSPSTNKVVPPYMPMMDPLHFYALQGIYPPNHLASISSLLPTPEQIKFYTDLLTHNSRVRFPFPFTQDGAIGSTNVGSLKK